MTVEEYRIGQLYTVASASKNETGGGDGVEILINEPFDTEKNVPDVPLIGVDVNYVVGQYTQKLYHLAQKAPMFVRLIAPPSALVFTERAWNAYPYCRTVITVKIIFFKRFFRIITGKINFH